MKVEQAMSVSPVSCGPDAMLSDVAVLMWEADCGFIPIVDPRQHVIGVITDRDICIAAGTRKRPPTCIRAGEMMIREVASCHLGDDLETALDIMRKEAVRRLPVTDASGVLVGVLSIDDVVAEASRAKTRVSSAAVIETLKTICLHRLPVACPADA